MADQPITDRHHLATLIQEGIAALVDLQEAWLSEDSGACYPAATGGPRISGGRPGSSTETIATGRRGDDDAAEDDDPTIPPVDQRKYRDRDHLGRKIAFHVGGLKTTLAAWQPHTPDRPCSCCDTEPATHGSLCWPCSKFLREVGQHCNIDREGRPTDRVHAARPKVRWCECPPSCCTQDDDGNTACADHAEEGRRLSRRCRGRKELGLWDQTDVSA